MSGLSLCTACKAFLHASIVPQGSLTNAGRCGLQWHTVYPAIDRATNEI